MFYIIMHILPFYFVGQIYLHVHVGVALVHSKTAENLLQTVDGGRGKLNLQVAQTIHLIHHFHFLAVQFLNCIRMSPAHPVVILH